MSYSSKTKNGGGGESVAGGYQEKHSKQVSGCYADLSPQLLIDKSFWKFSYPSFPGTERETSLQMEISLINVNISYKRATATKFSELHLCLLFLKNNQLKIITMPTRHMLGWYILLPCRLKMSEYYSLLSNPEAIINLLSRASQGLRNSLLRTLIGFVPAKSVQPSVERW